MKKSTEKFWFVMCSLAILCCECFATKYAEYSEAIEKTIASGNEIDVAKKALTDIKAIVEVEPLAIYGSEGQQMQFFLYRPKGTTKKLPCLVFLHGGNTGADLRVSLLPKDINKVVFKDDPDITLTQLPMIGAIVSRGYAVATITFRNEKTFKKSITQQIQEQVGKLKALVGDIFLVGHSFGAYMMTQFLAHERTQTWLNENVAAVGLYAPIVNEVYAGGYWCFDLNNPNFLINNAFYRGKTDGFKNLKEYLDFFRAMYPFSDLSAIKKGMNVTNPILPELSNFELNVHLFLGTGDSNATPRQTINLIKSFEEAKLSNWQSHVYKDSPHSVHRVTEKLFSEHEPPYGPFLRDKSDEQFRLGRNTIEARKTNFDNFINDICCVLKAPSVLTSTSSDAAITKLEAEVSPNVKDLVEVKNKEEDAIASGLLCVPENLKDDSISGK
ncbi:hypothetical protein FACS1894122_14170 [Alphaproteobacteria bacterium]|nr:hypothetical protein FACS1894122_14170 [Alphaproteobacteria bacterium]